MYFYTDCLRASSFHNARLGVSHTAANEGNHAGTKQKWRLMSRSFILRFVFRQLLNNGPIGTWAVLRQVDGKRATCRSDQPVR
jgi:hypothetical protein